MDSFEWLEFSEEEQDSELVFGALLALLAQSSFLEEKLFGVEIAKIGFGVDYLGAYYKDLN